MKKVEVEVKRNKAKAFVNIADSLNEAITRYGEELVWAHAERSMLEQAKGRLTSATTVKAGNQPVAPAVIVGEMNRWNPTIPGKRGKSLAEKAAAVLAALPEEERRKALGIVQSTIAAETTEAPPA